MRALVYREAIHEALTFLLDHLPANLHDHLAVLPVLAITMRKVDLRAEVLTFKSTRR